MRRQTLLALLMVGFCARANADVLCKKPNGALSVRAQCKAKEVQLDLATLGLQAAQCPPDSVEVGRLCVDKYEVSVWETTDAETIKKMQEGKIKSANDLAGVATQRGDDSDDYDAAGCPDTGNGCTHVYAVSIPGVIPSRFISWFQAAAACRNAGKRLLTSAEWQMAALGTLDPGLGGDGVTTCNTNTAGAVATGSAGNCISDVGAFDMVGNVWEWVADWVPQSTACPGWGGFSDDDMCLAGASTTSGPGALIRGGPFDNGTSAGVFALHATDTPSLTNPATALDTQGFRCARLK
jgi:hypothetical protein